MERRKVVIIGAGHVGSHVALSLTQSGIADEIVLLDIEKEKAAAQAMDIDDSLRGSICGHSTVIRSGTYTDVEDAQILVTAFGRSRRPGENRLDLFDDSIRMANEIIGRLKQHSFQGIMISVSNPADIVCEYIRRAMGWERQRCFGTGTSLETYRLLRVLSRHLSVSRTSIQAFCMGEHGNSGFIVWSHIFVNGKAFAHILQEDKKYKELDLVALQEEVKMAGDVEIDGKGCTEFGIANVVNMIITAVFHDQKLLWPCSVALNGEYGEKDVAAGVPCIIGRRGIERVVEMTLHEEEKDKFKHSCEVIRGFLVRARSLRKS